MRVISGSEDSGNSLLSQTFWKNYQSPSMRGPWIRRILELDAMIGSALCKPVSVN